MKFSVHFKFIFATFLLVLHLGDVYANPPKESNNKNDNKKSPSSGASNSQNNQSGQSEKQSDGKRAKEQPQTTQVQNKNAGTQKQEKGKQEPQGQQAENAQADNKAAQAQPNQNGSPQLDASKSVKQKTEIIHIRPNFIYTHKSDKKEVVEEKKQTNDPKNQPAVDESILYTYYSYQINKENQAKIANSTAITQIKLGIDQLIFDDLLKLPNRSYWGYIRVFFCKHNVPLMIRFKITENEKGYHYYYALDVQTKKYKNIGLTTLDEPSEKDKDNLTRHPVPSDLKDEDYCKKLRKGWEEMFGGVCKGHEKVSDISHCGVLDITITSPRKQSRKGGK